MPIPREEQETTQTACYGADTFTFGTTNPVHMRYMLRRGLKPTHVDRVATKWAEVVDKKTGAITKGKPLEWDELSWTFTVPADWYQLPRPKKHVSEETRAKTSERMKGAKV